MLAQKTKEVKQRFNDVKWRLNFVRRRARGRKCSVHQRPKWHAEGWARRKSGLPATPFKTSLICLRVLFPAPPEVCRPIPL